MYSYSLGIDHHESSLYSIDIELEGRYVGLIFMQLATHRGIY
jgi:hypothetical protein